MKKKTITIAALTLVFSAAVLISDGKPMKNNVKETKTKLARGGIFDPLG
jgi:ABC-type uncharacterized transport system YnjBCD substrate-binding protein